MAEIEEKILELLKQKPMTAEEISDRFHIALEESNSILGKMMDEGILSYLLLTGEYQPIQKIPKVEEARKRC